MTPRAALGKRIADAIREKSASVTSMVPPAAGQHVVYEARAELGESIAGGLRKADSL